MNTKEYLSISEFARLSGIVRKTLIYYDEIGLFSPELVKENQYRYYTYRQLDTANLIWSLKEIGMSLAEIKKFTHERSPERMVSLFSHQKNKLEAEIFKLEQIKIIMQTHIEIIRQCKEIDTERIYLLECEAEAIFPGPAINYSDCKTVSDAAMEFYKYCDASGIMCGYPMGAQISRENMQTENWKLPNRFYFKMPSATASKPTGLYAIGYAYGDYGQSDGLYRRISDFIRDNNLLICGNAYEEYLINEISTQNPDDYLFRVAVQVSEPKGKNRCIG